MEYREADGGRRHFHVMTLSIRHTVTLTDKKSNGRPDAEEESWNGLVARIMENRLPSNGA